MKARLLALALLASTVQAQEKDYFAFIPEGGRSLLLRLVADTPALAQAVTAPRSREDWALALAAGQVPGAGGLDEWQARTLADYLAYAGAITDAATAPPDGRDMTLGSCQSCHIVTVVVTQARGKEAWLGTLNKPSHVGVPLTPAERDQLADYLTVNAGLPIDAIPPELRAGGASY